MDRSVSGHSGPFHDRGIPDRLTRIVVDAHAKINLFLKVQGKRADGYHLIESVVQTITLHDTLTLEAQPRGIDLEVDDPNLSPGRENLVWRAAASLPRPDRGPRGALIRLAKRIPVGAGLGGGSSDAAATLVGLRRLWRLDLSDRDLLSIAAAIGSDVPFFLTGGTARLTGTGTEVEALPDLTGYDVLVVFPGVGIPTAEVYALAGRTLTSALKISSMARFHPTLAGNLDEEVEAWVRVGNDLEPYARSLCPAIGKIRNRLLAAGAAAAAMTGSGSAVFGVFRSPVAIQRALTEASAAGLAVVRCSPLSREEHRRRLGFD
ncbi:MAG TPA: 4-(cytidine 5'-diphospho)-2-C-methyl-D-erythritol kinase [Candidatus Dormibacteraeota bacterium]|nr:4-(cytidine 5'-diphospho)-2-C-methyl-D-erythritol kinase [Candidatus Dormibacteraeota bacterium]